MSWRCLLSFLVALAFSSISGHAATVLVLQFHNNSQYSDLDWIGTSIAETLQHEIGAANQIVLDRDSRAEGMRRLSLRSDASFTKATLIRLGQTLDADFVCYGAYDAKLPDGDTQLKDSTIQVTAHLLNLRKMSNGPDISETGAITELSRLEEHLAWGLLRYLEPSANLPVDRFLSPQKLIRLDAEESYSRGLLSSNPDQQEKWFAQAAALDPRFFGPVFELGKLALERKEYAQALGWFERIPAEDPSYPEARFNMGLSAFGAGNYQAAAGYFRELLKSFPMSEVYNNLGAAESEEGLPVAIDDLRHALEGDPNDPVYLFNLGAALLRNNYFDEAAKRLQAVLDNSPDDASAQSLLDQAQRRDPTPSTVKAVTTPRLKRSFNETAYRQLKAMMQPKSSS